MKTFLEMRADLENLQGLTLNSISGQATPFKIIQVDDANDRLILDVAGIQKSRPLDELRRIWAVMCEKPAAHVDSVLGGSGSARSQPETILANLPYVEWLQIEGKKNVAYVGDETHEYGTLRRMSDERAAEYTELMRMPRPRNPLLPPVEEEERQELTREELIQLENREFVFTCLGIILNP